MTDDNQRQEGATSPDLSRQAATSGDDTEYSLSIEEALAFYEAAGLPRTPRSIQRYCAKGHLKAHRVETPFGEKFLISPASVESHIAYIKEVRPVATGRDESRQAATSDDSENREERPHAEAATVGDAVRQPATGPGLSQPVAAAGEPVSRPVAAETGMMELLKSENEFLRGQVVVKDEQIKDLTERARETNHLIGGLQRMLSPLLNAPERNRDERGGRDYIDGTRQ
jgi:hypothetical protein